VHWADVNVVKRKHECAFAAIFVLKRAPNGDPHVS
jgi:hypothetical protein